MSYLYNAPSGVPGDVTRLQNSVVEPIVFGEAFLGFGGPYKLDPSTGKAMMIDSADAASVFAGIVSRSVPSQGGDLSQSLAGGIPDIDQAGGGVVQGYVNIKCSVGTPVKGQPVYMRITADTGKLVGDLETAADSGKCVALVGVVFASNGKDADSNAEIFIK